MTSYDIGDVARIEGTFAQGTTLVDPDTVELTVQDVNGVQYSYAYPATISRTSVGLYYVDFQPDVAGLWRYRWFSTGAGRAAEENVFYVRPQTVTT